MDSSWDRVGDWYDQLVGEKGHYYHQNIILPNLFRMGNFETSPAKVLDLGCGQGILARHLPSKTSYVGIDLSPSLIAKAKQYEKKNKEHRFFIADITKPLPLADQDFTHAALILALQNCASPLPVLKNASHHLKKGGYLLIVLNHPCFRIPRQSSWQIDAQKKWQYRRVDRYFSPLSIPIQMHPGKKTEETWSYHFPLSAYSKWLKEATFSIESIEEWCSDKKSSGKAAAMENRSRQEFPLFLAFVARKN